MKRRRSPETNPPPPIKMKIRKRGTDWSVSSDDTGASPVVILSYAPDFYSCSDGLVQIVLMCNIESKYLLYTTFDTKYK